MSETILILGCRDFLRQQLEAWIKVRFPTFEVVAAKDLTTALAMSDALSPAIIIMPMGSSRVPYLDTVPQLLATLPNIKIILLSLMDQAEEQILPSTIAKGVSALVPMWELGFGLQQALSALVSSTMEE